MSNDLYTANYNPDVLSCIANLSNDEVFTPPDVANSMLDLLPQELFQSPATTFLDPACKSGVFLREIAKRLLVGLGSVIPDRQQRINHIFQNQLYGIAITELTSLLSRRSLYCSKYPNSIYSVALFDDVQGNVRFKNTQHRFKDGKCLFCGAAEKKYGKEKRGEGLETHAYELIHTTHPEEIFKMRFDVIIGNPPYQLSDGGNKASAKPIYQLFVEQAKKLCPRYLSMVIPARWFSGGKGLDEFRNNMLTDKHLCHITDYFDSTECFPGVDISGGICYFLWARDKTGECEIESRRASTTSIMVRSLIDERNDIFIRFNEAVAIVRKVDEKKEISFSNHISARKPFGLETTAKISSNKLTSNMIEVFAYPHNGYIERTCITRNFLLIDKVKVCISYAYGERGEFPYLVIGKPFIIPKGSCCTETYLVVEAFDDVYRAQNMISYMMTKFFRFLVLLRKNTQHATKTVYSFVPEQDYSKPWTDEELYAKYGLTDKEIAFIESMIKPME